MKIITTKHLHVDITFQLPPIYTFQMKNESFVVVHKQQCHENSHLSFNWLLFYMDVFVSCCSAFISRGMNNFHVIFSLSYQPQKKINSALATFILTKWKRRCLENMSSEKPPVFQTSYFSVVMN